MAFTMGAYGLKDPLLPRRWWLVPVGDALMFFIWTASLFLTRVCWRGTELYVRKGRFVLVSEPAGAESERPARTV
jgi:hypothetical protein